MLPLMTAEPLSQDQIVTATRLLLRMARTDGAKSAEEVELIRQFYEGFGGAGDGWPAFAGLDDAAATATVSAAEFPDPAHRDLLVATCLMVGYADGVLSASEIAAARGVATSLGIDDAAFEQIRALVKDHMLARLVNLPDAASVTVVARELG